MQAVILIGHGSLRSGSGAAMIRLAARAREAGVAPIVAAAFLNYSAPDLASTLRRCVAQGARDVLVLPYFLVPGWFVASAVPRLLKKCRPDYPGVSLRIGPPFGAHPALAELTRKRAAAALAEAAPGTAEQPALLMIAHGSPDPSANAPIEEVTELVRARGGFADVTLCYLGLNTPLVDDAIDAQIARGQRLLVAVPYFLQLGGHVAEDLPALIDAARARHPGATILLAEHLSYDPLLVEVIARRVQEAGFRTEEIAG